MYIAQGQGQTTTWGQIFSLIVLFSQYSPLLKDFLFVQPPDRGRHPPEANFFINSIIQSI